MSCVHYCESNPDYCWSHHNVGDRREGNIVCCDYTLKIVIEIAKENGEEFVKYIYADELAAGEYLVNVHNPDE
jgi:hypothetical protein